MKRTPFAIIVPDARVLDAWIDRYRYATSSRN